MRITFLMPKDSLNGGTKVASIYARKLIDKGHDVTVITCAPAIPGLRQRAKAIATGEWKRLRQRNEPGHIALSGVPHKIPGHPGPIRTSDVPDADVIVATWWETAAWMDGMPPSKGRKVHLIQGYETWGNPKAAEEVHRALRLPNLKIAISSDPRQTIEQHVGNLGIAVVPNAVDLAQFNAPERDKQERPTVGFVYSVAPFKGADICGRACELAREEIPELRVVAFGTDHPSADMPLPAGTGYSLRPRQESIREIYRRCDAWLFGSRIDSFGLPILEAMACRTPVISVPVGAAPELLGDGTGILVQKESPEAMAKALVEICRLTDAEWQQRSRQAHAKACSYTWDDAAERLLSLLPG